MLNRRKHSKLALVAVICIGVMLNTRLSSATIDPEVNLFESLEVGREETVAKQPIAIINVRNHDVYLNRRTKTLLRPPGYFDELSLFSEGLARVVKNNKVGFINEQGEWVIKPIFNNNVDAYRADELNFHEGAAAIETGGKYGFINRQGQLITPVKFDFVKPFDQGAAIVTINKKYGLINKQGKFIISPELTQMPEGSFAQGGMLVERNGQEDCINNQGVAMQMAACQYIKNDRENGNISAFRIINGAVYLHGKLLPNQRWDNVEKSRGGSAYRGLYIYTVGNKWGLVHESGEIRTPPQFEVLPHFERYISQYFNNGLALVKINGKYGFIDETGKYAITPTLEKAKPFEFDPEITTAYANGKMGYINRQGKFVIPAKFTFAGAFNRRFGTLAMVEINKKYGFIDRQGNLVVPAQFDEINDNNPFGSVGVSNYYDSFYNNGLVPARRGKKWVYLNTKATIGISQEFDEASPFRYGVAEVKQGSRVFYIDLQGKLLPF